jgi:HTH-type transcriptional regulator/antitoxin HipB
MKDYLLNVRAVSQMGEALRRRRKLLGWSQEELAHHSGVKQANLSALENGAEGVRLGTIFRILAALDLELSVRQRQKSEPHIPVP